MHPCSIPILNPTILEKMLVKTRVEIKVYGYLGWRYNFPFPFNLVCCLINILMYFVSCNLVCVSRSYFTKIDIEILWTI